MADIYIDADDLPLDVEEGDGDDRVNDPPGDAEDVEDGEEP